MITTIKLTLKSVFGRQANYSKKKKKKRWKIQVKLIMQAFGNGLF